MTNNSPTEQNVSLSYFLRYFKKYQALIYTSFTLLVSARIASTFEPLYLKHIIDSITSHQALSVITGFLSFYFGIKLLGILLEFFRDFLFSPVVMGVSRDIEVGVFDLLLKLPVSYHADQRSGAAARAIARGSQAITFVLDFSVSQVLPPIFELLFVTILLLKLYSWQYAVITLGTVIIYAWFTIWSTEKRQSLRIEGNQLSDQSSGILVDSVTNIDTVKYFNNESSLFKQFIDIKDKWLKLLVRNNRLFAAISGTQGIILMIGLGLILILSVRQAALGIITVGDLVLLSTYIVRLSQPIAVLGFVYGQFKNSFADLDAMAKILNQEVTLKEPAKPIAIKEPRGEVVFNHVGFGYSGREKVINDLNFAIRPGQKAAFVGSSGAGKSTIAKLLFRLYDVSEGGIQIDGVDLRNIDAKTRRKVLGIVPQEPALFNDTIANNIKFGKPDATKEEVIAAAKAAHIHDFIAALPEGYETKVGERGIKISGGEKQRVAIARAVVKNPTILVFDEATSSLDSKSEQAILGTLNEVAQGRTTLAIAHRLSTIIDSDIIFVLQKGEVVESGTHRELLAQAGVYAHLWKLQSTSHKQEAAAESARVTAQAI